MPQPGNSLLRRPLQYATDEPVRVAGNSRVVNDVRPMARDTAPDPRSTPGPGEMACAVCGRDLWWCGLPPDIDGDVWICGECDAARNFDSLEDY